MRVLKFRVIVSFFKKGNLEKIEKIVTTSSSTMAWKAGLALVPVNSINQAQIKIDPM